MFAADLSGFGSRLLAELRVRRSLNDTLFRHLCRALLPVELQAEYDVDDLITDMAEDKDAADGRLLELYTGILLRCQGHAVSSVGGAKNDGGVDVLVESAAAGSGSAVISESGAVMVQCKQYRDTPVNVDVLVQLLGAMDIHNIQHGLLVTSSAVTDGVTKLERYLDERYELWQHSNPCTSCNTAQRPMRAQVWDRNKLIALLDQHAAAFVRLRERLIQQLLDDQHLMRMIRQKRGMHFCVRHAIRDPSTFPHNECAFDCRPVDQPIAAATSTTTDGRKARQGARQPRKRHGFHFSHRDRPLAPRHTRQMVQPPDGTAVVDMDLRDPPQAVSKATSVLLTPQNLPSYQQSSVQPSTFVDALLWLQQRSSASPTSVEHSGSVPHSHSSHAHLMSIEQAEVEQVEGEYETPAVLQLNEEIDSDDETDKDDWEDGDDSYGTPDEADGDCHENESQIKAQDRPTSVYLPSSGSTASRESTNVGAESSDDPTLEDLSTNECLEAPALPNSPIIQPAATLLVSHDPSSKHHNNGGAYARSPTGMQRTPRRQLGLSVHQSLHHLHDTASSPPSSAQQLTSNLTAYTTVPFESPDTTPSAVANVLPAFSSLNMEESTLDKSSLEKTLATCDGSSAQIGIVPTVCEGENGELFVDSWEQDGETPLESLSEEESTVSQLSPVDYSHSHAPNAPVHGTSTTSAYSPARCPGRTARPRSDCARDRGGHIATSGAVSTHTVMTGEQEQTITERINDKRSMGMDEIDTMLQVILTRPAPHHHIQLPSATTAAFHKHDQPQPHHKELEREVASQVAEVEEIGEGAEVDAECEATTASEEREEEVEEMDALSTDEEMEAYRQAPLRSPVPLSAIKYQPPLPPASVQPHAHTTSPARNQHILMRPKRTPRISRPSPAYSGKDDKVPYTDREVRELILLYRKYGGGARRFANILEDSACHWLHVDKAGGRTGVNLKDKWRNLTALSRSKCDVLTVMCNRIEREAQQQRLEKGVKEGKLAIKRRGKLGSAG